MIHLHLAYSWNRHLIVLESFACPCEPEGYVVWDRLLLVGSPMAEWSQVRGHTENGSPKPNEYTSERRRDPARRKPRGPMWSKAQTEGLSAGAWGRVCHGARPGTAQRSNVAPTHSPSCGSTTCRKTRWGPVRCHMSEELKIPEWFFAVKWNQSF